MIWEQGSIVIVNLTRLTENGVSLCHRYWPEEGSDLYHIYEVKTSRLSSWCALSSHSDLYTHTYDNHHNHVTLTL